MKKMYAIVALCSLFMTSIYAIEPLAKEKPIATILPADQGHLSDINKVVTKASDALETQLLATIDALETIKDQEIVLHLQHATRSAAKQKEWDKKYYDHQRWLIKELGKISPHPTKESVDNLREKLLQALQEEETKTHNELEKSEKQASSKTNLTPLTPPTKQVPVALTPATAEHTSPASKIVAH